VGVAAPGTEGAHTSGVEVVAHAGCKIINEKQPNTNIFPLFCYSSIPKKRISVHLPPPRAMKLLGLLYNQ
jgi:hypothetical protein